MKLIAFTALLALPFGGLRAQSAVTSASAAASSAPRTSSSAASATGVSGPDAPKLDPWGTWRFVLGEWIGEGSGAPGEGKGGFSFKFELGEKVFVRRSFAEYPATKTRPATRHEDLMIIHRDADGGLRADYYDNEAHLIRYTGSIASDRNAWIFLSAPAPGPRFRLTYTWHSDDRLGIKFEISGPQPGAPFKAYITATVKREK